MSIDLGHRSRLSWPRQYPKQQQHQQQQPQPLQSSPVFFFSTAAPVCDAEHIIHLAMIDDRLIFHVT